MPFPTCQGKRFFQVCGSVEAVAQTCRKVERAEKARRVSLRVSGHSVLDTNKSLEDNFRIFAGTVCNAMF